MGGGSVNALTIAAPRLVSRIRDWCVLEVITLSDHQCIEFSIQERSDPVNTGRGGKVRNPLLHASPRARAYQELDPIDLFV